MLNSSKVEKMVRVMIVKMSWAEARLTTSFIAIPPGEITRRITRRILKVAKWSHTEGYLDKYDSCLLSSFS